MKRNCTLCGFEKLDNQPQAKPGGGANSKILRMVFRTTRLHRILLLRTMPKVPEPQGRDRPLTPLELEVMNVLWALGPANVRTIRAQIRKSQLAYTTVQTVLNILCRKNKAKRSLKNGVYFYCPVVSRQKAADQAIGDIIERFFAGSAEGFVLRLLEGGYITIESLAQIRQRRKP